MVFNFNDLSKSAKVGYNALYNVIFAHSTSFNAKNGLNKFTVPLCLNSDNKVSLTEKNFVFFESVLSELKVNGYYNIVLNNGRAVDDVKTDFYTVEIVLSKNALKVPSDVKTFDFSEVDTSRLLKRDGKAEKAKTAENNAKKEEEKKEVEETSKALEETSKELEETKKELAKKEEQLNKKAIAEFNDDALLSIANCIEVLVKKHCPIPSDFDFTKFECDLFKVIESKWDLKAIEK
jgi:predicted carbohydrate-binding protein with CBM5 and CBM33 domain